MLDKTELENLVGGLTIIKEEFIKNKEELKLSIRKDIVAAELKDILSKADNYEDLKMHLSEYIDNLYNLGS